MPLKDFRNASKCIATCIRRYRLPCALIFIVLLSSVQAYPMTQQGVRSVPTTDPQPFSDKSTRSIPSLSSRQNMPPQAAPPPTVSVGEFLGLGGLETPAFEKSCKECCKKTIEVHGKTLPVLQSCGTCELEINVEATGACAGKTLGFEKSPSGCFAERCSAMLVAVRPSCLCLGL